MKSRHERKIAERQERSRRRWLVGACLASAGLLVGASWLGPPRSTGDLWMALAGGRDVVDGGLGRPDDWAFTTAGRTWLNQNWLAHLLLYGVWRAGGEWGLLALKAALLAGVAAAAALAGRRRWADWAAAILVAAGALAAGRSYLELRPNLLTLLLAASLLAVLYASARRPHWAWAAAGLVGLWANLHGGFIFGLGVLALWAACGVLPTRLGGSGRSSPRRDWPAWAAPLAAAALAAFANPFGAANLTHPFTVAGGAEWRRVNEWQPLFGGGADYGSRWEFLLTVAALAGLAAWRLAGRLERPNRPRRRARPTEPAGPVPPAFDVLLAAGAVAMALAARRFVPLTLVVLAPPLASMLTRLLRPERRSWPAYLLAAALAAPVLAFGPALLRPYYPDNPAYPRQSLFERMHGTDQFPSPAVRLFLADKLLGGNVFHEWRWEGFLRWHCRERLRLFMGGRAQQVYDLATDRLRRQIVAGADPAATLKDLDVHLAVVPMGLPYDAMIRRLVYQAGSRWAVVCCDGRTAILADADWPDAAVVRGVAEGHWFAWPVEHRATGLLSRAMCLASPAVGADASAVAEALMAANRAGPTVTGYGTLGNLLAEGKVPAAPVLEHFETEARRLAETPTDRPGGLEVLQCRRVVAAVLAERYAAAGRETEAKAQSEAAADLAEKIGAMLARWR